MTRTSSNAAGAASRRQALSALANLKDFKDYLMSDFNDPKSGSLDPKSTPTHVPLAGPAPTPSQSGANGRAADRVPAATSPDFAEADALLCGMTTPQLVAARRLTEGLEPDPTGSRTKLSYEFRIELRQLYEKLLSIFRRLLAAFRIQMASEDRYLDDNDLDKQARQELAKAIDEVLDARAKTPRGQRQIERDVEFHNSDLHSLKEVEKEYLARQSHFSEMPEYKEFSEKLTAAKDKLTVLKANPPDGLLSALRRPQWQREVHAAEQTVEELELEKVDVVKQAQLDAAREFKDRQSSDHLKKLELERTLLLQQVGRLAAELATLQAQVARAKAESAEDGAMQSDDSSKTEMPPAEIEQQRRHRER